MNARERMLAAIEHKPCDRVPTDIWAVPEMLTRLRARFGADADLNALLHIDGIASVQPAYVGPPLPDLGADQSIDVWGIRSKRVNYGTGDYFEISRNPLADARTIDDLDRYPWPRPEWFDCSEMPAAARDRRTKQIVKCGYMAPFFLHNKLRGLEQSLIDPLLDPDFTRRLLDRISDVTYRQHRRMFEACEGLIDITEVTDDYGMQSGPLISLTTFREFYKPHLRRFIGLAREFGIRVFHHDDGAIRDFLPDLVDMGIDVLNPIQWRCPGMDMEGLKRDFGKALAFHGGIDNQQTLPFGSDRDVRAEVRRAIDTLASDKTGYILAPCHNIQAITPVENVIAMYDEAWNYGKF